MSLQWLKNSKTTYKNPVKIAQLRALFKTEAEDFNQVYFGDFRNEQLLVNANFQTDQSGKHGIQDFCTGKKELEI